MRADSFEFLRAIQETPSPSGFEQPVQRIVRERMKSLADEIRTDVHGNCIVALNPTGSPRVMLAGHCDQIGLMVTYINDEGFVHFESIGGVDAAVLPGSRLTVHAAKGTVEGVVGRKAIHLMKPEERDKAKVELGDLWLDIGARNRADAQKRVAVGDPITYKLGMARLGQDLVASPGFDDKVGTFVVMEALRLVARRARPPTRDNPAANITGRPGQEGPSQRCARRRPRFAESCPATRRRRASRRTVSVSASAIAAPPHPY